MAFTSLKYVLENVLKEKNLSSELEAYTVFYRWPEIAGPRVAAHARPVRIRAKTLYLEVDDHLWLAQLKYMKDDILRKMEAGLKPGLFTDLKFLLKGF
jgi:predicted nucleic acid-binding Zn ribbon protein